MKNFLFLCLILISCSAFGQSHLEQLSFEDTQNPETYRSIRNGTTLNTYIAADGSVLNLRDTLLVGTPVGSAFSGIIKGRPSDIGNIFKSGKAKNRPGPELTGEKVVILAMKVEHEGSKQTPLSLVILLGEASGTKVWSQKFLSVTNYERSVRAGELQANSISVANRQ